MIHVGGMYHPRESIGSGNRGGLGLGYAMDVPRLKDMLLLCSLRCVHADQRVGLPPTFMAAVSSSLHASEVALNRA